MDQQLIERYAAGAKLPYEAIAGLSPAELNATPVPGTWSIQQIILHLMDSDLISSDRMKRVIAEDRPTIIGFDETAFARSLFYEDMDAQLTCELFAKNRLLTAEILRRLPPATFDRVGIHNERGPITLQQFVLMMIEHLDHHLKFAYEKRRLLGKPL